MPERDDVRWGLAKRFEFIEWRAYWVGRVNRSDLEDRFGVSTPQASVDLRTYQEAAPNNIEYDATEKAYVATDKFKAEFLRLSADRYLLQLDAILKGAIQTTDTWFGSPPPASVMQTVVRSVDPKILQAILRAITEHQQLDVDYQSLTKTQLRPIEPHSLAFDGHRWHARAWCVRRQEFRDFVLTRIRSIGDHRPAEGDPTYDIEWHTTVELKIIPDPRLPDAQKAAIELDYGMKNGVLTVTTRAALAFYLIKRLNLDLELPPERKQIELSNLAEIQRAQRVAKEAMKACVANLANRQ